MTLIQTSSFKIQNKTSLYNFNERPLINILAETARFNKIKI